jgi:hypothetical protein
VITYLHNTPHSTAYAQNFIVQDFKIIRAK